MNPNPMSAKPTRLWLLLLFTALPLTVFGQAESMITPPPSLPPTFDTLTPRSNPLSELLSIGMSIGESVLSEINSPRTQLTKAKPSLRPGKQRTAQTWFLTGKHTTSTESTTTGSPTSTSKSIETSHSQRKSGPPKTKSGPSSSKSTSRPDASTSSDSGGSGSNNLVIILAVVISVLLVLLILAVTWFCLRRRRKRRMEYSDSDDDYPQAETPPDPSLMVYTGRQRPYGGVSEMPAPTAALLGTAGASDSDTTRSSPGTDPFLAPSEIREGESTNTSHNSGMSGELEGNPISPLGSHAIEPGTPLRPPSPIEIDGTSIPWVPRKNSQRGKKIFYPSQAETSRFDFGFGPGSSKQGQDRRSKPTIPRRPVPNA